jgi:hypothetical protein
MSRKQPVLTVAQYREAVRLFRVEVSNVAWSLVESPAPVGAPRRWKSLSPEQSLDVFDRLMAACTRMSSKDNVRVVERLPA